MPIDPPANHRLAQPLSPMLIRTAAGATPSASAATSASAVREPVPMSAAVIRTVNVPSASAVTAAVDGTRPRRTHRPPSAAQQPVALAAHPGPRIAVRPAEPPCALPETRRQRRGC